MSKIVIGKEEWCGLLDLGLPRIKAKVDSGAKTSALHAFNIRTFQENGVDYVTFDINPIQSNRKIIQSCKAQIVDQRAVKSSSGEKEKRIVIKTNITMGGESWDIELTLTNRDAMGFRMLLGREAMGKHLLIDPNSSFCLGDLAENEAKKYYSIVRPRTKPLRIILLANNPELYSNKRIMEAGEERGHEMRFINIRHCYINITSPKPEIHYRGGEILKDYDAVIPRIRPSMTFYGCAIARQFRNNGIFCLNDDISIYSARDKLGSLQILSSHGIDMPVTSFADSPIDTKEIIKIVGGAPLVIKLLVGTQGKGIVKVDTNKAAQSVVEAFKSLKAKILLQEFVKEADGKDIRCFVIDGKVVGAMQREAAEGEFRANLHLGGKASAIKITALERKIAIKASNALKLKVAGVDIIRSRTGPKVLEVNSSPGLEGIENITEKDIASLMIECIEKHLRYNAKTFS